MIDSLVNLVFRCRHTRLSRPLTPVSRPGQPSDGSTYVVCLDCGKHFDYDPVAMRIGKAVPVDRPAPHPTSRRRLKQVLLAAIPLAVLTGSLFRKNRRKQEPAPPR